MSNTSDFGTFGRYTEMPIDQMTLEQRKGYELVVQERGEAPGPYKIFIQNPRLLQVIVPVGKYFQQSHSSLSDPEREIVVNLINGKWHAAYSNYEHEMIGEGRPAAREGAIIDRRSAHVFRRSATAGGLRRDMCADYPAHRPSGTL
jgi:4-carboxymuconolactone decarboxylase